jgi:Zn-dependent protease with chaperone function
LAAALLFVRLVLAATERRAVTVSFRKQLFISRALLCVTLITTMSAIWFVRQAHLTWSLGIASFEDAHLTERGAVQSLSDLSVPNIHLSEAEQFSPLTCMVLAALLAVALLKTLRTIGQYRELAAVLRSSVMLRRHMRTVILISDRIEVPFSLRTLRSRWVVLPNHLLGNREELRFAVGHELQHHRQGDTSWAWISQALSILFWPNPVVHLWRRWHGSVQEMACDEALLQRPGFKVAEYARCLLNVAERALTEHQAVQFAPSMAAPHSDRRATASHLQRRIEMLFASSSRTLSQPLLATALVVAICCGVSVSALAAGLTSTSRKNVVDAAVKTTVDEQGTTNADPDCEHQEDPAELICINAGALQHSDEAPATQSTENEPDCPEPSLDRSASSASRK